MLGQERICIVCGSTLFNDVHFNMKICSDQCRQIRMKQYDQNRRHPADDQKRLRYLARKRQDRKRFRHKYINKEREIERYRAVEYRKNNPDKCREMSRRKKLRKRIQTVECFSDTTIYNRDDWTCGICRKSIDSGLKYPDPMSKSIDHIFPISKGGLHIMGNCQAAHFVCNNRKKNKIGKEYNNE